MQNNFITESAHIDEVDPILAEFPIVRKRVDNAKLDNVLNNGFGFGGTNGALVLSRYKG